jgi:hypothetical protein
MEVESALAVAEAAQRVGEIGVAARDGDEVHGRQYGTC